MDGTPHPACLTMPMREIQAICRKYDVQELAVFGSALRNELRLNSDIDFLVTFRNGDAGPWGDKLAAMEQDLEAVLGRPADLTTRGGIERSRNWVVRASILGAAQVIFREP